MGILPHFHPSTVPDIPRRLVPRRHRRHAVRPTSTSSRGYPETTDPFFPRPLLCVLRVRNLVLLKICMMPFDIVQCAPGVLLQASRGGCGGHGEKKRCISPRPPFLRVLRVKRRWGGLNARCIGRIGMKPAFPGMGATEPDAERPAPTSSSGRAVLSLDRDLPRSADHTGTGSSVRKELRARFSRLFTVPTGIPISSAISS
jgi:hypothetical protein